MALYHYCQGTEHCYHEFGALPIRKRYEPLRPSEPRAMAHTSPRSASVTISSAGHAASKDGGEQIARRQRPHSATLDAISSSSLNLSGLTGRPYPANAHIGAPSFSERRAISAVTIR